MMKYCTALSYCLGKAEEVNVGTLKAYFSGVVFRDWFGCIINSRALNGSAAESNAAVTTSKYYKRLFRIWVISVCC